MWERQAEQKFQLLNILLLLSSFIFPSQFCNFTCSSVTKVVFIYSLFELQQNIGDSALGEKNPVLHLCVVFQHLDTNLFCLFKDCFVYNIIHCFR